MQGIIPPRERLIVALDMPEVEEAERLVAGMGDSVVFYKVGMELAYGGGPSLKLMAVAIEEVTEVGRASPGFSSRELVYHPLPQGLSTTRLSLAFHYVSLKTRRVLSFAELMERPAASPAGGRASPDIFDGH